MYKPKNYTIKELAHPQIIDAIGENNTWMRLDEDVLRDLQRIRNKWFGIYGTGIYCNRLNVGLDSRGLRPPNDPDGSFYSVHKQGKAFDLEPANGLIMQLYEMIYQMIINKELYSINTLEDFYYTKTWVHVAKMNHNQQILIIKP